MQTAYPVLLIKKTDLNSALNINNRKLKFWQRDNEHKKKPRNRYNV